MEDAFIINGGNVLKGKVKLSGAKNISCKLIIAALLFDQEVILKNIPHHGDVYKLAELIKTIGGDVEFTEANTLRVDGRNIKENKLDFLHASKIRTSFMMFAPLLYKFKKAYIPNPGGCRLGSRSIDRVVSGMQALGTEVDYNSETGYYYAQMNTLPQGKYTFAKPTHTGTELLIMVSVLSEGNTITIENAALEPEIDDLINFLNQSGADIHRDGNMIVIKGTSKLTRTDPFTISTDRNEAITYACMALATGGEIVLDSIEEYKIKAFIDKITEAGAIVEKLENNCWKFSSNGRLKAVNMTTDVHPGFMTDWQPPFAVLMTQAEGESIIHERMMENRFSYVPELRKIGAQIEFVNIPVENPTEFYQFNYDPEQEYDTLAVKIHGPQKLHGGVMHAADLRAGATSIIAALTVPDESIVTNASMLERGYEDLVEKVKKLGGNIKKV